MLVLLLLMTMLLLDLRRMVIVSHRSLRTSLDTRSIELMMLILHRAIARNKGLLLLLLLGLVMMLMLLGMRHGIHPVVGVTAVTADTSLIGHELIVTLDELLQGV